MKTPEQMAEEYASEYVTDPGYILSKSGFLVGYQAAQQWISVKERLPEINEDVLISNGTNPFYHLAYLTHNGDIKWFNGNYNNEEYWLEDVTHWMPLPKPPEEKK